VADNDEPADILHIPSRANHLEGLEEHLRSASCLARALWIACNSTDAFHDQRDRQALAELANALADHASAALLSFYKENRND
jgi:hypothetical protein